MQISLQVGAEPQKKTDAYLYSDLPTSNKRTETPRDHRRLRELMDTRWKEIIDFSKKSPSEVREFQFERIKNLVRFAFETVPLYHEKYSSVGFRPGDLRAWNDFECLPVLTKEELIDAFPSKSISSRYPIEFTTRSSGSSGKFVTLVVSPDAIYLDTIQGARQFYFQSGGRYWEQDIAMFIYTSPWWVSSIDGDYPSKFFPTTMSVDEVASAVASVRPKVLSVYPSYLVKMYEKGVPLKDFGVELIVVHSEQTNKKLRLDLSVAFGVAVLDEFSSEELTRIALECPCRHYHLEEDACYIELVDPKSHKLLDDGSQGLIVGTNLLNEATPIIRYSQGDLAKMTDYADCDCGSRFRIIENPHGRFMDSIILPNGDYTPASCFMDIAYNWYLELGVPIHGLRYQIVQHSLNEVGVFLIPGPYSLTLDQLCMIQKSMYQLLPPEVEVNVHIANEPPVHRDIKYCPVISLIGRDAP